MTDSNFPDGSTIFQQAFALRRSPLLFLSALAFLLAYYVSESYSSVKAATRSVVADFADNTQTYVPRSDTEDALKKLIAQRLKAGYETFDFSLIAPILTVDFELRSLISENEVLVEARESYLATRKTWEKTNEPVRKLLYSIRRMVVDETGKNVTVVAVSTYKSKYFSPRFVETLLFKSVNERWMLKRQVLVPLHPSRPELYDVQIFVVKPCDVSERKFQKLAITHGVDAFVDQCLKGSYDSLPLEVYALILFVFREPPPVGAEIKTELVYERTYGDFPFDFTYRVKKREPYFVIANEVYSEDLDGWFLMRVYVDGIKVGERKIGA